MLRARFLLVKKEQRWSVKLDNFSFLKLIVVPSWNKKLFSFPITDNFDYNGKKLEIFYISAKIMFRTNIENCAIACGSETK